MGNKLNLLDSKDPRHIRITQKITQMIATDLLPIRIVDKSGFLRLLFVLEPRYSHPSKTTFSNTLILQLYQDIVNLLNF